MTSIEVFSVQSLVVFQTAADYKSSAKAGGCREAIFSAGGGVAGAPRSMAS